MPDRELIETELIKYRICGINLTFVDKFVYHINLNRIFISFNIISLRI